MRAGHRFNVIVSFVVGFAVAIPIATHGLNFFADHMGAIVVGAALLLFTIIVGSFLAWLFRDQISRALFGTAAVRLECLTDLVSEGIRHAMAGSMDEAVSSGAQCVRVLFAGYARFVFLRGAIALIFALVASIAGLATSSLMFRQNELMLRQNELLVDQNTKIESQNSLMRQQMTAMDLQTRISQQQVLPQFVIYVAQRKEPGDEVFSQDQLVVNNSGALVHELEVDAAVFAHVELFRKEGKVKAIREYLAINGYYAATLHSPPGEGKGQGELVTMVGNRNNERAWAVARSFAEYAEQRGMIGNVEIRRFLRLSYRGQLGEKATRYFYVPNIYGSQEISAVEGEALFKRRDEAFPKGALLEFETLSAQTLFEAAIREPG